MATTIVTLKPTVQFLEFKRHRVAHIAHENLSATHLPVVFVHGLTASVHFWEAAMPTPIRQRSSWYSLSLPLHYPSTFAGHPFENDALTETGFAEIMHQQIEELIPNGRFVLVGYSAGGFAVLNYAAKFPDRIAGLVSISGFTTGRAKGLEGILQFFSKGRLLRRLAFWSAWKVLQSHRFFLRQAVKVYANRDRELLRYPALEPTLKAIFPDVAQHDITAMRSWFRYLLEMELSDEYCEITCPVLVFAGDADPIIPFDHQTNYAAALPNARLVIMPEVGHVPFAEAAAEFERELVDFLGDFPMDESSSANR